MTAAEARAAAAAEGLSLPRRDNGSYRYTHNPNRDGNSNKRRPWRTTVKDAAGRRRTLCLATAEQAALEHARYRRARGEWPDGDDAPGLDILSGDSSEEEFVIESSATAIPPPS